jgi:hypothetical protein
MKAVIREMFFVMKDRPPAAFIAANNLEGTVRKNSG